MLFMKPWVCLTEQDSDQTIPHRDKLVPELKVIFPSLSYPLRLITFRYNVGCMAGMP